MTYYEVGVQILRTAGRPLTTREITDLAIERRLIEPRGKTPLRTMSAALYEQLGHRTELVKLGERATSGLVRWTLRET
jgi:HB1/ASXL restriction endonuclease-like protein with HTH domain